MSTLKLTLVTPFKRVFEGLEVTEIKLPAEKGELTIYPEHSPLVTTLDTGLLTYTEAGKTEPQRAVITWGYCEVMDQEVKLLAETVTTKEEVNLEQAQKTKAECESKLATNKLEPTEIVSCQEKLKKAQAEITLAGL